MKQGLYLAHTSSGQAMGWALDLGVGPFGPTPDPSEAHMDPSSSHPIQRARA